MYEQIKSLLEQIKHHQHQHKVTIFNKQKNYDNMKSHNIAQGKLIELLKSFPYFSELKENFGVDCLLKASNFLEPYFLRKDKVFVNVNQTNSLTEYLLCEGVVAVYEMVIEQIAQGQEKPKKVPVFLKYISNGSKVSFSEFHESQYQIVSHSDCLMLKLPNTKQLDPSTYQKRIIETSQLFSHNPDFSKCKLAFVKCIQDINRIKKINIEPTFGLSPFDFNELFMKAKIQSFDGFAKIYQTEQIITKIGLILKGKIVEENVKKRSKKIIRYDNAILKLYKKDFTEDPRKVQKNQTLLEKGDWIGLQDYLNDLQTKPFRYQNITKDPSENQVYHEGESFCPRELIFTSRKEIRTKQYCKILWIPIEYFAPKFNYQINFTIVDQWKTMIEIKQEARTKNDKIHQQIETQRQERQQNSFESTQILPKLPGKLQEMSHNISNLSAKTEIKSRLIYEKQLKFGKLRLRNLKISDTSLLGITMRRNNDFEHSEIYKEEPELNAVKKFSKFANSVKTKKFDKPDINQEVLRSKKSQSENKIQPLPQYLRDTSPEELIMFPEAYEPNKLSPDLKSQLYQAEKALRLEELQYNLPNKHSVMALELSRAQSIERDEMNSNRLTSLGSKASLVSQTIPSSPVAIYKNIAEKISFKFPNLDEKLRIEKLCKTRNKKYEKVTIKDRIQSLKMLEEIERKKRLRIRNEQLRQYPSSLTQIRRKNAITYRENLSEKKLSLYF